MKKSLTFGLSLLAAMAAVAACRVWQRSAAFEEGGLLTPGHPSTWCLLAALALAAVGFFLLSRWTVKKDGGPRSYLTAFALPCRGLVAVYILAGALLVAAGVMDLWQKSQDVGQTMGLSRIILAVLLIPAGVGVALVGLLGANKREAKGRFAWPLLLPAYAGCLWLIALYQGGATDPNAMAYAVSLFGAVCAVLCCYTMAAFSFEKPMARATLWLGAMALTGLGAYLADCCMDGRKAEGLACLGYMLYVLVQVKTLALRCQKPAALEPWTPDDVENEVTEDV